MVILRKPADFSLFASLELNADPFVVSAIPSMPMSFSYRQRKLQRSVSDIRRSRKGLIRASRTSVVFVVLIEALFSSLSVYRKYP